MISRDESAQTKYAFTSSCLSQMLAIVLLDLSLLILNSLILLPSVQYVLADYYPLKGLAVAN